MSDEKVFALIDANTFYVSCHTLFEPRLEGQAVAVLSANDGNVVAVSPRAKCMGVRRGMAAYHLRGWRAQGRLTVFSSTWALYADLSQRVVEVLMRFADIEMYSIDESFADLSMYPVAERVKVAQAMCEAVARWTGIAVAVGIGPTKTIAKLANTLVKRKRERVYDLATDPYERERLYAGITVDDVWGIGARTAQKLYQAGVYSVRQLIHLPDAQVRQMLGVRGLRTTWELRGVPLFSLTQGPASPKSISRARVFGRPAHEGELKEAVAVFVTRACEKVQRNHLAASAISVSLSTNTFRKREPQHSAACLIELQAPTNSTRLLSQAARDALARIVREGYAYHRLGVLLLGLVPEEPVQGSLFLSQEEQARERRIMTAIQKINARYGRDTIFLGTVGFTPHAWRQRAENCSPRWTTRWREIPVVQA
ncbi:MAG: Y-family DNA polymerase [Ktedonobacteraceae bacterium]